MRTRKDGAVLRQIGTLFNFGVIHGLTDGQLLERFTTGRGEAAELAFAALVERHGAMVLRVCRALLAEPHDAQDAFQATFLILVKKARGLWVRDSLGPWLYQVAFRTASCARSAAARRRGHERRRAEWAATLDEHADGTRIELEEALHEEINQLPERYRVPIVLCDLEGHTCEEAARRMGRPVGTVKSWRSRGRERLRQRLLRRGLAPSAVLAVDTARAAVPGLKAEETVQVFSERVTAGVVPASVRLLVNGVLKAMFFSKLRTTATTVFALAFLAAGIGAVARVGAEDSKKVGDEALAKVPDPAVARSIPSPLKAAREDRQLTLRDAIRIGLGNSAIIRVIKPAEGGAAGSGYVIAPARADLEPQRLKAELMAEVRSIEQLYWSLARQYTQLWSGEKGVELAEEVLKREQKELEAGRGKRADVDEAQQGLDKFRLNLETKTSELIDTERRLRRVLGLPPADDRRIVPVTPPSEALLEPDWEKCKAVMLDTQPDIVGQRENVKWAEEYGNAARIEREKAFLQQVLHQTTRSLARFFLEIEANYNQFKTASRSLPDAAQRLESHRAFYEEGRITVGRYFDAVRQYTSAFDFLAQSKESYNVSIIALEEAKGTLLGYDNITLADGPKGTAPVVGERDGATRRASHEPDRPAPTPQPATLPDAGIPPAERVGAGSEAPRLDLDGKTVSFQFTVGRGSRPVEIRGSFTITPARPGPAPTTP